MNTSNMNSSLKKSEKEITVSDVMEELEADNYFEKAHHEMLAIVKDALPYKQMQEVALTHMFNSLTNASQRPLEETREEKKRHISKIGRFGIELNKVISKTLCDKLSQEAPVVAKRALKRLAEKISESSNSMTDAGEKRKQDDDLSEIFQNANEQNKSFQKKDSESCSFLNDVSNESVSSVHTSDLSSFDDEIVVSSEDENGEKRVKRIPFKTAEKAYFEEDFSEVSKSTVHEKNTTAEASKKSKNGMSLRTAVTAKKSMTKKAHFGDDFSKVSKSTVHAKNTDEASPKSKAMSLRTTVTPKKSTEPSNISSRPKRERKPNSRYSGAEMYL